MVTMLSIYIIFKKQLLGVCHKILEMCKIVHFHGFQLPKFGMHPAPEVYDFAIKCMNFLSHFEHLICHIKHGADILARQMVFRAPVPNVCTKKIFKFQHWFYA